VAVGERHVERVAVNSNDYVMIGAKSVLVAGFDEMLKLNL